MQLPKLLLVLAVCLILAAGAFVTRALLPGGDATSTSAPASTTSPSASTGASSSASSSASGSASASSSAAPSASAGIDAAALGQQQAVTKLAKLAQKYSNQKRTEKPTVDFTFGQFNIQGAIHRGNVGHRMALAVSLLRKYHVEVGALQEFESGQRAIFDSMAGGTYARYPSGGKSLDAENSVIWDKSRFQLLQGQTRPYPYFHGAIRNMPRVLLRDKLTGVSFWVTSYHNPANVFGNAAGFRATAVSRQISDNNALRQSVQAPIIVSGDMNDRAIYFCRMGGGTGMHSADGSSYSGNCQLSGSLWIDWVLGTPDVSFSGYLRDRGSAARGASDHPIVITQVQVTGRPGEGQCVAGSDGSVPQTCAYPTGLESPPADATP
ncbi:endonuclease/exonuclease/phosphatase family protein [Nocardioides mangrovicus]|uniref:Endonuclease/exonuclease/phosphatase family protein n=1 Tax=Nocardioides mangrovicus TaxID=2478913 RepID=A0A3L8P7W2_9ACTN|nr:endonuclease/exonuclease/phosphatase family protein [Nocardioides mangrovicus]